MGLDNLRIQTTSDAEVSYIHWLGYDLTSGKSACIPREK